MDNYKWANLPENPTKEEIKSEIDRLNKLKSDYANSDSALKIQLNSAYGCIGFTGFICYDRNVAQTVTMQSADLIKYTIRTMDEYFKNVLIHKREILEHLGINPDTFKPHTGKYVKYADTDSLFVVYNDYFQASDQRYDMNKFILEIYKMDLQKYLEDKLVGYCKSFGALELRPDKKPAFIIELENICYSVLRTASKKYIKDSSWVKGKTFKPQTEITIKGLDANQSATPKFAREKMKEIIKYIMTNGSKINDYKISVLIKNVKDQFKKIDIESVCRTERITEYAKHVVNDTAHLEFKPGAKPHVKGAGYYNYLLYNNKKAQAKYPFLTSATKVRWYYTKQKTDLIESFAYYPDNYPKDIAPEIDYDLQFEKAFLNPINRILSAIGLKQMDPELVYFEPFGW
jgi:DNA polymerase elongation subunit (family B)